jgi:hypothetical protein
MKNMAEAGLAASGSEEGSDSSSSSSDGLLFTPNEIERMSNSTHGLTYAQKLQLFEYIQEGLGVSDENSIKMAMIKESNDAKEQAQHEKLTSQRRDFVTNVVMIVNSVFEYGFRLTGQGQGSSDEGDEHAHFGQE